MMQDVTQQHRVEGFIRRRETRPGIGTVIDRRFSAVAQVDAHCTRAEHRAEMMRDKTIATANVQNFRSIRNYTRDLQSHVISAADFAPSPLALEATYESVYNGH